MVISRVDQQLDIRGKICPYTLIETRDFLKSMKQNEVLEVIVDYEPAALSTIPSFCEKKGYPFETIGDGESLWRIRIRRTD